MEDALDIRRRILLAFERAEATDDPDERQRLLTLVIVGAGPTGVEMAGAIAELAKVALAMGFRSIDPREARVLMIESGRAGAAVVSRLPFRTRRRAPGVTLRHRRAGQHIAVLWGARGACRCSPI